MTHSIAKLTMDRLRGGHMMRDGALEYLTDADLRFSPGGDNVTLGDLFKAFGELEHSYIQSLITLKHDWSYHRIDDGLTTSVTRLQDWFIQLDEQMEKQLAQMTDADLQKAIDRTAGVIRTVDAQLEIYIQANLIFLGKLVIYFRAMQKPLPPSIQHYIA